MPAREEFFCSSAFSAHALQVGFGKLHGGQSEALLGRQSWQLWQDLLEDLNVFGHKLRMEPATWLAVGFGQDGLRCPQAELLLLFSYENLLEKENQRAELTVQGIPILLQA